MGKSNSKMDEICFGKEINLTHFDLLRTVGKGWFSTVKIVRYKKTNELYILKYINKERCIKKKQLSCVLTERNILETINHEFMTNLIFSFQDDHYMFMVMDFMSGGDLNYYIKKRFSEYNIKFFIAEMVCVIKFLHDNNIIHRDIKPSNILLDSRGHFYLTDFNLCINTDDEVKSKAGTLSYMAPEVYTGKYDENVDWWSLGIVIFEIMFKYKPSISLLSDSIEIPECNYSLECIDFLKGLLCIDPVKRLGDSSIKKHPFLKDIDWKRLKNKEYKPGFKPKVKPNFNYIYDLEETGAKLKYRPRKKEIFNDEMMLIEKEFKYYAR